MKGDGLGQENGISDGSNDGSITREQLATMLQRAMRAAHQGRFRPPSETAAASTAMP
ncbi:MAG: hypothetical protein ACLUES_11745 [Flavonifractor plautii]